MTINSVIFKPSERARQPDTRRMFDAQCEVGKYLVLRDDKVADRAGDFVSAEIKAHDMARRHPGQRVVVAQVSLHVVGVPYVYEVHGKKEQL